MSGTGRTTQQEPEDQTLRCSACGGDGWYVGHEDECHEAGDCNCTGVQIQCEKCGGQGRV